MSDWEHAPLPKPSLAERVWPQTDAKPWQKALRLLIVHRSLLMFLTERNTSTFMGRSTVYSKKEQGLPNIFGSNLWFESALIAEIAHLIVPKLLNIQSDLKSRQSRKKEWMRISDIRETSPACLRKNARLPGRDMIEKAGPKQMLMGIQRIAKYDTTENRYLLSTCRQIRAHCQEQLKIYRANNVKHSKRAQIQKLKILADNILSDPRLEKVQRIRGGERPSNVMLGNKDYRAIWRLWSLFRYQESLFSEAWLKLNDAWSDILLMALWSELKEEWPAFRPVDTWYNTEAIHPIRMGLIGPKRKWICIQSDYVAEIQIERIEHTADIKMIFRCKGDGLDIERQKELSPKLWVQSPEEGLCDEHIVLDKTHNVLTEALILADEGLTEIIGDEIKYVGVPQQPFEAEQWHGLSALNNLFYGCLGTIDSQDPICFQDCSYFNRIETVASEKVDIVGWSAGWSTESVDAKHMFGVTATQETIGQAAQFLKHFRGRQDTAIVISDSWNHEQISSFMRQSIGTWFVWSSVALALYESEQYLCEYQSQMTCLVISYTNAALDIKTLYRQERDNGWVWVRPYRNHNYPNMGKDSTFAADNCHNWTQDEEGDWIKADAARSRDPIEQIQVFLDQEQEDWNRILVYGLDETHHQKLRGIFPNTDIRFGENVALAKGALDFLRLHHQGHATWEDELPKLKLKYIRDRKELSIDLFEDVNRYVAPGKHFKRTFPNIFEIQRGQLKFRIPMHDENGVRYSALCQSDILPLERDTPVKMVLDFTHGRNGIQGYVSPESSDVFERMRFNMMVEEVADFYPVHPKSTAIFDEAEIEFIKNAIASNISSVGKKKRKKNYINPEGLFNELDQRFKNCAFKCIQDENTIIDLLDKEIIKSDKKKNKENNSITITLTDRFSTIKFPSVKPEHVQQLYLYLVCRILMVFPDKLYQELLGHFSDIKGNSKYILLGIWSTEGERIKDYLNCVPKPSDNNDFKKNWLKGLVYLLRCPKSKIEDTQLIEISEIILAYLKEERDKEVLYNCFLNIFYLCHYRKEGFQFLQPQDQTYEELVKIIDVLDAELDENTKTHGGRDNPFHNTPPIMTAKRALFGKYEEIVRGT